MRKILCNIIIVITVFLFTVSSASGELSGYASTRRNYSESLKDGTTTSTLETYNSNLILNYDKAVTRMISYQLNFSTAWVDSRRTDADGDTIPAYRRSTSPTVSLQLSNPMYSLSAGYDRQDNWTTANLSEEGKSSSEFYYTRFGLSTKDVPSLSISLERDIPDTKSDLTEDFYSLSSSYKLPSKDLQLGYNITLSRSISKSPSTIVDKTIEDNNNIGYNAGYGGSLFGDVLIYGIGYKGNYSRNKTQSFISQSGSIRFLRTPLGGLYALGSAGNENVGVLSSQVSLVDEDTDTSTGIDLSNNEFNNIGIWVSPNRAVDRLYVYVNKDVSSDAALTNISNWKVYKSNFNQAGTWTEHTIGNVTVSAVDSLNNIYRYEITFLSEQSASYFKAVNMVLSDVADVFVTEIEAYGTDIIPNTEVVDEASTSFNQGLSFSSSVKITPDVNLSLFYSVDRDDQNPVSLADSIGGIFTNIYSDSVKGDKSGFTSNITRGYGASTSWMAHELLSMTVSWSGSENFDKENTINVKSSSYNISFQSHPLPTIDAGLSLIRSENYQFGEKDTIIHSVLLSLNSKLYKDINMITDVGISRSESFEDSSEITNRFLNGSLSARFTRRLNGSFNYNFSWNETDGSQSTSKGAVTRLSYRPGRNVFISGNFRFTDSNGNVSTAEGLSMNLLPLPAFRIGIDAHRTDSKPGPSTKDTFGTYVTWYLTKFADLRVSYSYTRTVKESQTEAHNLNSNLNCRF